ncbi:Lactose regulatory protein LAC9 [Colletotrichum orbiculare MAFF 240422]|uniref:Lactose regulatory protein LAC9 n=1 Tax=Colletotrichum orbiculare (strain 104-T / ATCC 96160 / CBS 514.97 / LARS 414 / MAFF 240422) TaxID=1213857 RepID=A0A484FFH3_COLOR|nr:Lactose regulatory protein LAC9 [Colletotrichum orbiculare MAFF 240422]
MAMLTSHDSGYLGSSSGSQLLGEIDSVIHVSKTMTEKTTTPSRKRRRRSSGMTVLSSPEHLGPEDRHVTSRLIDAYFTLYNSSYPIIHEKTFRARVHAGHQLKKAHTPWRVVYHMVLAIGHWLTTTEVEHLQPGHYAAARSNLSIQMLESGTIETVQAFLLMGNYLQKRDRTNTGYNFIGLAYRMALGLGLHREPPRCEDTLGHERRRQLFWTIYCFESGFNITTGRPPTMSDDFIDTRLPLNIDDKELPLKASVPPAYTTNSSSPKQHRPKSSTEWPRAWSEISIDGGRVFQRTSSPLTAHLGFELRERYLPTKVKAEKKYVEVAMQSIHDIAAFCVANESSLHHGVIWYATYFLFQATLVLEANYLTRSNRAEEDSLAWRHSVSKAGACLKALEVKSRAAKRCLEMLDRIHGHFQFLPQLDLQLDPSSFQPSNAMQGVTVEIPTQNGPSSCQAFMELPSENDFAFFGENQTAFGDDAGDPSLRMLLNEASLDFMGNMPLDLLLGDWAS